MEITLRKASNLSKTLLTTAQKMRVKKSVSVSIHLSTDQINSTISAVEAKNDENMVTALSLIGSAYIIRSLISEKNSAIGVDKLLLSQAELSANEAVYNQLSVTESSYGTLPISKDIVHNVVTSNRDRLTSVNGSYASEDVNVSLISDTVIENAKSELLKIKRAKSEISDKLTSLNSSNFITLPENVVKVLKDNDLV